MIKVATVGVHDQMENMTGSEEMLRNLMSKAAPTAIHSTRTEKIAALFVSVSFVNITKYPFSRRPSGGVCILALALWATYESLWRQEKQHTSRITCSGYRVFSGAW
jgi:hypothetical protein